VRRISPESFVVRCPRGGIWFDMLNSSSRLRIAVLGAGRIGSTFAFQLARTGGHDVTVIARPNSARLRQLERDSAIIDVKGERVAVQVSSILDDQTPYDLVIVTILAHQVEAILPALQRSAAKCFQFMFNNFRPEHLQQALGGDRCCFGMPFLPATLDGDGRLKATIGAAGQKTIMSRQRWVDIFTAAGLPSALEPDMPLWLRCHVPLCVAFESVAVAGDRRGGGASWSEAMVLARGVHACFGLIKGLGYPIYPKTKRRIDGSPASIVAALLWSMSRVRSFRTLLATGKAECCALIDAMVEAAPLAKSPVSVPQIEAMKPL